MDKQHFSIYELVTKQMANNTVPKSTMKKVLLIDLEALKVFQFIGF